MERSVYSLRHTAICVRIILSHGKVNIFNLAKNAGTSAKQIERFYARNFPLSRDGKGRPELCRRIADLSLHRASVYRGEQCDTAQPPMRLRTMSFEALLISCTGCDFEATEAFPPMKVIYRLDSTQEIEGRYTTGWCYRCNDYRYVENIGPEVVLQDLDSAQKGLADVYMRQVELSKGFAELSKNWFARLRYKQQRRKLLYEKAALPNDLNRFNERIANLRMLLDIASKRNARPRCLHCWSEETVRMSFETSGASDFVHTCGGKLRIEEHPAGLRINFGKNITCYIINTEGEFWESRLEDRNGVVVKETV